jgi:small subunit ribosomal protein S6
MRTYEVMYIVRPDIADEDLDKLVSNIEGNATAAGATLKSTDRLGKRRLAYVVGGFNDGLYILMTVEADGKTIHEIERRLRVAEQVIKFLTVRVDEEQKRLAKVEKLRASHVKRAPTPAPVETSAAEEPAAETPATA